MNIQFINPVVMVKDIEVSKRFYTDVIQLKIVQDSGAFVLFENHFSIHQARELMDNIFGHEIASAQELQGKDNLLLYFEVADLAGTFEQIKDCVELIHPIKQQFWGQYVFRFYDPDHHIVEIGEPM
jgi:catechol 2,3-dioxygenase-like lactoylglutathione lyase family enzyme